MNRLNFFSLFIIYLVLVNVFMVVKITHALYSDNASSSGNIFVAVSIFPTQTPTPTPIGIANHVIISEVQINGTGAHATAQDFIELYNPLSTPYDLNGHRLVKRTGGTDNTDADIVVWQTSTIMPSYSFYLWASSDNGFSASISANIATTSNIASDNSVAIRNGPKNTGAIVDALNWSSNPNALSEGTTMTAPTTDGQSMERKALSTSTVSSMAIGGSDEFKGNGYDTDNNSNDFVLRLVSQPQNSASPAESP